MDAATLVAGLKANAIIADAGMKTVTRLARVGVDDVVVGVVARTLRDVDGALAELASREAQVLIGPAVNYASSAKQAVTGMRSLADDGVMPTQSSIAEALRRIELVGTRIDELG